MPQRSTVMQPTLVRAIGRWGMVALTLNSIVGSGIFGLPAVLAALLGSASPASTLVAGLGMGIIVACYAEVASQFSGNGGTYLYVRRAFGPLAGIAVGWLMLLSRLTGCAAAVNLLVAYLGVFWPPVALPLPRALVITMFIGSLAFINVRGVGAGVRVSNLTVAAKLGVLALIGGAGLVYLWVHPAAVQPAVAAGLGRWLDAMLLLLFAFGGFESALNPLGEARDPRRDAGFALATALACLIVLYTLLQWIVIRVLPDAAHSSKPLADVAGVALGPHGAAVVAVGAVLSVYGFISANLLTAPRALWALAASGEFPRALARVHPRFRTPHLAIMVFALLAWGFSVAASFDWNVTLSAVSRLGFYGAVCVAVPVLRRLQPGLALVRLPGGWLLPAAGTLICGALLTRVDFTKSLVLGATAVVILANWLIVRHSQPWRATA